MVRYALSVSVGKVGYSLRPLQELVVTSFVQGRNVFVGLPSGSGKSLCYSLLPDVFNLLRNVKSSIVVVVSPLIVLMKDQVRTMTKRGTTAVFVGDCDDSSINAVCGGNYT